VIKDKTRQDYGLRESIEIVFQGKIGCSSVFMNNSSKLILRSLTGALANDCSITPSKERDA